MARIEQSSRFLDELASFLATQPPGRRILTYRPSKSIQERASELSEKQTAGELSFDERQELEEYAFADRLMRLIKARVRSNGKGMSRRVTKALRLRLRERARDCCEYCLIHEEDALFPHVPDHIIAVKHRGPTVISNLAWSCLVCNQAKGSDLASVDPESGRVVRLFDPRKDKWTKHFRLDGPRIVPLTAVGRVTERLLQFNQPENMESRRFLIEAGRYPR